MRRYHDPVEVRHGYVAGGAGADATSIEGPEQFLWRGRLWKVRAVLAHWVETGPWWQSPGVQAVIGVADDEGTTASPRPAPVGDLIVERELWRVEAGRGPATPDHEADGGVFDLSFDWADGRWQLVGCED